MKTNRLMATLSVPVIPGMDHRRLLSFEDLLSEIITRLRHNQDHGTGKLAGASFTFEIKWDMDETK